MKAWTTTAGVGLLCMGLALLAQGRYIGVRASSVEASRLMGGTCYLYSYQVLDLCTPSCGSPCSHNPVIQSTIGGYGETTAPCYTGAVNCDINVTDSDVTCTSGG